jgi:hypothetical protein
MPDNVEADADYRTMSDVVMTDVCVSPVKVGNRAKITFALGNRSAERILFGGVTVTAARSSRVVASIGKGTTTTSYSIPVAPGEVIFADGEVPWIEIYGLPISPGNITEAKMRFGTTFIPISLSATRESRHSS